MSEVKFSKIEIKPKPQVLCYQIPIQDHGTQEFVLSSDYYELATAYEKLRVAYEMLVAKVCQTDKKYD